jgi:penicillin-binding protein 1A
MSSTPCSPPRTGASSSISASISSAWRALSENVRANGVVQGGSTITQQLAKNLFLTNERSMERKIKEAYLALWLEMNLSKKEILQLYLDRAYLGGGTFGIAAAADFYFDKSIKDVTLSEAAMIAGLFKAPGHLAPHINLPAARGRANVVLSNMVDSGFATEGQVLHARLNPATAVDRGGRDSPDYFLDWAFEEVKRLAPATGRRRSWRAPRIDLDIQRAAEESLEYHLRQYGNDYGASEGAIVVLENNGAVRAIVGGRDYARSQFNRATRALRQTGSSFKTYVYTAAMEAGFTPNSVVPTAPITWAGWSPQNYNARLFRQRHLTSALVRSINTVPVRLTRDHLSVETVKNMTVAMGVESDLGNHRTMVLGTSGITVLDQATGYGTLANGGYAGMRHGITQLMTHGGEVVYDRQRDAPPPRRVVSEQAVAAMNSILVQIPEWGTGRRAALEGIRSGRQDRHHAELSRWLVCRLHRQLHRRRLVRKRRLHADPPHDRRLAAGDDLAAPDDLCAPERRTEAHSRRGGAGRVEVTPLEMAKWRGGRRRATGRPCCPRAPRGLLQSMNELFRVPRP